MVVRPERWVWLLAAALSIGSVGTSAAAPPVATPAPKGAVILAATVVPKTLRKPAPKIATAPAAKKAAKPARQVEKLGLDQFIDRALEAAPELDVARWAVETREADLQQARVSSFLPEFTAINTFGVARRAFGTVLDPQDTVDVDAYGPFNRVEVQFVQPLYTWGKITSGIEAATRAVAAQIAEHDGIAAVVVEQTKMLYYNIVLARSVLGVLDEAEEGFSDALETARERRDEGDTEITELDILYLRVGRSEVANQIPKLIAGEKGALEALRVIAGAKPDSPIDVRDRRIEPEVVKLEPLEVYKGRLFAQSPAWRQVEAGAQAKESELEKVKAEYYPDLFFTGHFGYAYAPRRDRQLNPFAWDDFNYLRGPGGVLSLRWPLNFHVTATKVQKARAELEHIEAQKRQARRGLQVELSSAYETAVESRKAVTDLEDGRKAGRAILTLAVTNFDLAIGDASEILNALGNYARVSSSYYESVRDYNLSLAVLARVLGEDIPVSVRTGPEPVLDVTLPAPAPTPP